MDIIRDLIDFASQAVNDSSDLRLGCGCALLVVVPLTMLVVAFAAGWYAREAWSY